MGKLLKYEFRKTLFVKLILLGLTAVAEVIFLIGVWKNIEENPMVFLGTVLLTILAIAGITFIGIHSMLSLYRDLNTRQSYMLFMTPHSSYSILGAKILENGISILLTGLFFGLLAFLDIKILLREQLTIKMIIDTFHEMLKQMDLPIDISFRLAMFTLVAILANWLFTIVSAHLAIILAAAVLAGKRFSGLLSFVLFIAINYVCSFLLKKITANMEVETQIMATCGICLGFAVIIYLISGWIMEKKLSV